MEENKNVNVTNVNNSAYKTGFTIGKIFAFTLSACTSALMIGATIWLLRLLLY